MRWHNSLLRWNDVKCQNCYLYICSTKYLQFVYHKVLTILQFTFPQNLHTECEINVPFANDSCVLICFDVCLRFAVFFVCFLLYIIV
jgi:hypothetical protein